MLFVEKHKPNKIEEMIGNRNKINEMEKWINGKINKILLISGPSGVGKTLFAELLLKKYNYNIIEFNIGFDYDGKPITDMISNILLNKNMNGKKNAIILDEIDSMLILNDKNEMNKLLNILTSNNSNVPIICIYNDINEKKISKKIIKIKKIAEYYKFNRPSDYEIGQYLNNILQKENITLNYVDEKMTVKHANGDIRRLLNIMQLIKNDPENVNEVLLSFHHKDNELNIFDSIYRIFNNKIDDIELINLYKKDIMQFLPSIHENLETNLRNTKNINFNEKYKEYFKNILENDIILTNLYQTQLWDNEFILPFCRSINEIGYKYEKYVTKNNAIKYSELLKKMNSDTANYSLNKLFKQSNINENKYYEYYFMTQIIKNNINEKTKKIHNIENLIKISDKINNEKYVKQFT